MAGRKPKERIYRIPAGIHCRIGLVSDLHNTDGSAALEVLERQRPDLIAVAGDLFLGYRPKKEKELFRAQENVLPFVSGCARIAPTYLSLGNHEWVVPAGGMRALGDTGAVVLDNGWVKDAAGRELLLGGLTSAMMMDYRAFIKSRGRKGHYPHEARHTGAFVLPAESAWLDDFERQEGYRILLCHHPEYWCLREPFLIERRIDLVLAGHAHGGQIRLFGRGLYAPGQGVLPKYTGGVFCGPHGKMVVSRGLSNTAPRPIPRLFNPVEVVIVELGGP